MIGPNFADEIDCGSFFDHIDDLLDFPAGEEVEAGFGLPGNNSTDAFPSTMWPAQSDDPLLSSDTVFSAASDLSKEISVPYEDIVHLEWLSNFVEDSFSGGSLTINKVESTSTKNCSSPVSVLESSSSCSGEKTAPLGSETIPPGPERRARARSKRPRPAIFNPRTTIQMIPSISVTEISEAFLAAPKVPSDSESFGESGPLFEIPKQANAEQKKKKKTKVSTPLGPMMANQNSHSQTVRKCMHCEITKTPQWRAGPMGPKTLCNACGVRYKSGRLFPEYRPAASPTFVPYLHSNSHKKVVEMRNKVCSTPTGTETETAMTTSMELIPTNNNLQPDFS